MLLSSRILFVALTSVATAVDGVRALPPATGNHLAVRSARTPTLAVRSPTLARRTKPDDKFANRPYAQAFYLKNPYPGNKQPAGSKQPTQPPNTSQRPASHSSSRDSGYHSSSSPPSKVPSHHSQAGGREDPRAHRQSGSAPSSSDHRSGSGKKTASWSGDPAYRPKAREVHPGGHGLPSSSDHRRDDSFSGHPAYPPKSRELYPDQKGAHAPPLGTNQHKTVTYPQPQRSQTYHPGAPQGAHQSSRGAVQKYPSRQGVHHGAAPQYPSHQVHQPSHGAPQNYGYGYY